MRVLIGCPTSIHKEYCLKEYLDDQLKYLLQVSQHALDFPYISRFQDAKMHAEMMAYGRALRDAGMEGMLRWTVEGKEQIYDMARYGAEGFDPEKCPGGLMDAFRDQLYYAGIVGQFNTIRSLYKGDRWVLVCGSWCRMPRRTMS